MVRCCRGSPPRACLTKIWLTNVGASVRFLTLTSDFSIIGLSCAARSSLQPALVPLEALGLLCRSPLPPRQLPGILIVTQLSRYCRAVVAVPSSATLPSFLDDGAVAPPRPRPRACAA